MVAADLYTTWSNAKSLHMSTSSSCTLNGCMYEHSHAVTVFIHIL